MPLGSIGFIVGLDWNYKKNIRKKIFCSHPRNSATMAAVGIVVATWKGWAAHGQARRLFQDPFFSHLMQPIDPVIHYPRNGVPVNPGLHTQSYLLIPSLHSPYSHGLLAQSSKLYSQLTPTRQDKRLIYKVTWIWSCLIDPAIKKTLLYTELLLLKGEERDLVSRRR